MIDLDGYRLMRQVRSASATPMMPARCKPNFPGLDRGLVLRWRKISPNTQFMVDPRSGARAVIRDTRSEGGRLLWSVLAAGERHPISDGRTDELATAQSIAEAALRGYAETDLW